jgi:hypothetical protein
MGANLSGVGKRGQWERVLPRRKSEMAGGKGAPSWIKKDCDLDLRQELHNIVFGQPLDMLRDLHLNVSTFGQSERVGRSGMLDVGALVEM